MKEQHTLFSRTKYSWERKHLVMKELIVYFLGQNILGKGRFSDEGTTFMNVCKIRSL
jgi:hypothetical protein